MKVTDGGLREKILQAIGDSESAMMLHAIRDTPKVAQTISRETGIPLSSVYRKLAGLKSAGLAIVSSFELTPEGKRQELLVSAVTEVRIGIHGDLIEVDLIPTQQNATRIWFELFKS